jgi:uncharacterized membrane protein YjjP (DUF1212 family)
MSRFSQNDNMRFLGSLLTWIGVLLAISLATSFVLPFPSSLAVAIGILLLVDFYSIRNTSRRMRNGYSESSIFDSLSSLVSSGGSRAARNVSLGYYCINCGVQHKQGSCPKCGSKLKKIGS